MSVSLKNHLFICAWNDSGGGYTNRLLDGHPSFACWPFEIQLGTGQVPDRFGDWFKDKYRWPSFSNDIRILDGSDLFDAIIDDELKSVLLLRQNAKHGDFLVEVCIDEWRSVFVDMWSLTDRTRASLVQSYIESFFSLWPEAGLTPEQNWFLGHCPNLNLDADQILQDLPSGRIVQVIRSPLTGFIDMRRRRPSVDVETFGRKWSVITTLALAFQRKYPDRFMILRFKDLLEAPLKTLNGILKQCGLPLLDTVPIPTWNGRTLRSDAMGPFGGVPCISLDHERENMTMLSAAEEKCLTGHGDYVSRLFSVELY